MNITVIGSGYVGLVAGACFADGGNDVICVDKDEKKIAALKRGEIPIFEPGLSDLVMYNVEEGRLSFTTSHKEQILKELLYYNTINFYFRIHRCFSSK